MEIRPVARAAVVGRRRTGSNRASSSVSSASAGSRERLRVRVGQVASRAPAPAPGSDRTMNDSVITSRASLLDARCAPAATTPTTAAAGRRTTGHQRAADGNRASSARRPRSSCVAYGGVERLANLRLQARLLVEADLEVREDGELRARLRVALEPQALVPRERLAQVALPLGRVAGRSRSRNRWSGGDSAGAPAGTPRDSARTRARSPRTPSGSRARRRRSHARTRRTACAAQPSGARSASRAGRGRGAAADATSVAIGCSSQRPSAERVAEVLEQVLAADRPAGLSRGPRRVRAPVRALAASCRERRGETRVAVGDLEVSDHRVRDRGDPPDVVHARHERRSVRVGHHRVLPQEYRTGTASQGPRASTVQHGKGLRSFAGLRRFLRFDRRFGGHHLSGEVHRTPMRCHAAVCRPGGGGLMSAIEQDRGFIPVADPAPLGLAAFALTTFLLSGHNATFIPDVIWIGPALFYGGLASCSPGCGSSATATSSARRRSRPTAASGSRSAPSSCWP